MNVFLTLRESLRRRDCVVSESSEVGVVRKRNYITWLVFVHFDATMKQINIFWTAFQIFWKWFLIKMLHNSCKFYSIAFCFMSYLKHSLLSLNLNFFSFKKIIRTSTGYDFLVTTNPSFHKTRIVTVKMLICFIVACKCTKTNLVI